MKSNEINPTYIKPYVTKYEETLTISKDESKDSYNFYVNQYHLGKGLCSTIENLNP